MDINELYRWRFCLFVNDKLHNRFDSLDFLYIQIIWLNLKIVIQIILMNIN